jgi:hypothetical protein
MIKPRLEIGEDGNLYRLTPSQVADSRDLIAQFARAQPCVERNLFEGMSLKLYPDSTGQEPVVMSEITEFELRTWFAPWTDENGASHLIPVWGETTVAVETAGHMKFGSDTNFCFFFFTQGRDSLVVWRHIGSGKLYRPPLRNIFGDGKVCMGHQWSAHTTGSLFERHRVAKEWFLATKANADLSHDAGGIRESLMFDPETLEWDQVPASTEPALTTLRVQSSPVFEGFFA